MSIISFSPELYETEIPRFLGRYRRKKLSTLVFTL